LVTHRFPDASKTSPTGPLNADAESVDVGATPPVDGRGYAVTVELPELAM
jgi:hypothetical protein